MMDASKLLRSLSDVVESIAITYKDTSIIQADAKVIETQQVNALPKTKKLNLEDVRAVLAKLSQHGKIFDEFLDQVYSIVNVHIA